MADKTEFLQAIDDAILDADSLERFINGSDSETVLTRLSAEYPTIRKALKELFENGGIAGRYKTLVELQTKGASLEDGSYALVADDADDKNGIYIKQKGTWVKSAYDPLAQAKTYADAQKEYVLRTTSTSINDLKYDVQGSDAIQSYTPEFTMTGQYYSLSGNPVTSEEYKSSSPIVIPKGATIQLLTYGLSLAAIVENTSEYTKPVLAVTSSKYLYAPKYIEYTAEKEMSVIVSCKVSVGQPEVKIVKKATPSLVADARQMRADATTSKTLNKFEVINTPTTVGGLMITVPVTTGFPGSGDYPSRELVLKAGDILTFSAIEVTGTNLWWMMADGKATPLISQVHGSTEIKDYTYVAKFNMTVRIVGYNTLKPAKLNGKNVKVTDVGFWFAKSTTYIYTPFTTGKVSDVIDVKKGDVVFIDKIMKGVNSVALYNETTGVLTPLIGNGQYILIDISAEWTADADCKIRLCGATDAVFKIRRANVPLVKTFKALVDKVDYLDNSIGFIPDKIILPEMEYVFATAMNYILKTGVVDGVDYIHISQDLGKTWTRIVNILGDIVGYHFFSDGTIMLCSPTKVYWTDDYLTLNESTVYDHDGSVFVPTGRHFFSMQTGDKVDFVGDTEMHSWGEYVIGQPARVWYTTDNAKTVKCSIKFGTTSVDGVVRSIRHVHRVYYHQKTNYWYMTTGDLGLECQIIRGRYDVDDDIWTWEILNAGIDYKFGNLVIDDNNIAFIMTDYTDPSQKDKKGLYRVPAKYLGDITKYRRIYAAEYSEWAGISPLVLMSDYNGNRVILPDYLGEGYLWVSRQGFDFKRVEVSPHVLLTYAIGENYNGDIYCVAYEGANNNILRLNSGSYNLTKALRNSGMGDFMRYVPAISGMTTMLS